MNRLRKYIVLIGASAAVVGALWVLVHFVSTGEMLVRHGHWATFADRPIAVVFSMLSYIIVLIVGSAATYLLVAGWNDSDRFIRSLEQRTRLDNSVAQDRQGRDVRR
jgi:hypothetical protein